MPQPIFIVAIVGVVVFAIWYGAFMRINRVRGLRILRWLKKAIAAHGKISGVTWISPSHFLARLDLSCHAFQQPFIEVRLAPRQEPFGWGMWRFRHHQETLTFLANLTHPLGESLQIGRTRWNGCAPGWTNKRAHAWPTCSVATLFISTQPAWTPQISACMENVVSTREFEFLAVTFHPRAPHFSATFSLKETLRHPSSEFPIIESLREIAEGSRTRM
jgi:hypothetical protein